MGKNHHTRAQSLLHGSSNLLPVLGPALALGFYKRNGGWGADGGGRQGEDWL